MAGITVSTERHPSVCTRRFATAKLTADTAEALTYEKPIEILSDLITAQYQPKMNSAEMYASGIAVESYVAKAGGTLNITVVGLNSDDEKEYFGCTIRDDNVIESASTDYVPDRMVIYSTERSDGTMNLYKFLKAKFTSQGETVETTDASGVKYNGTGLQAEYKNVLRPDAKGKNKDMVCIKGIDVSTEDGKTFYDNWFNDAMFGVDDTNAPSGT